MVKQLILKALFKTIVNQPFAKFLLALVAIGLIGYVIWRFVQAIKDPENKGNDAKGLAVRIGYAVKGLKPQKTRKFGPLIASDS